jgi:hypothetical protein
VACGASKSIRSSDDVRARRRHASGGLLPGRLFLFLLWWQQGRGSRTLRAWSSFAWPWQGSPSSLDTTQLAGGTRSPAEAHERTPPPPVRSRAVSWRFAFLAPQPFRGGSLSPAAWDQHHDHHHDHPSAQVGAPVTSYFRQKPLGAWLRTAGGRRSTACPRLSRSCGMTLLKWLPGQSICKPWSAQARPTRQPVSPAPAV